MSTTTTNRRPRILVLEGWGNDFRRAITSEGGTVEMISPTAIDLVERALFVDGEWDAIVLTGGGDVDPREYGQKPHKRVYGVSETRDYCELLALDFAQDAGVPVLGICRGSQLMAVHNGGKLKQHITGHRGVNHLVFAEAGTKFRSVIGNQRGYFVSLHHQVVTRHGSGWQVAARDSEGNIEAIESKDGRCLGVQFHPEMDATRNECSRRIFRWLVLEAAKRAGLQTPRRSRAKAKPKQQLKPRTTKRSKREQFLPSRARPQLGLPFDAVAIDRRMEELALARRGKAPVYVSYVCPRCGLRFDKLQDREDHLYWLHGDPVILTTEPPPGHPDWENGTL